MTNVRRPAQLSFARRLRRESTDAERLLWSRLRRKYLEGAKFKRQQPIGSYIVDFVSFEKGLVVEVDGGQHAEGEMLERDAERTRQLEAKGYRVLRFWDNEVLSNLDGVLETVLDALARTGPPPLSNSLPRRGERDGAPPAPQRL
ncbi:MAG: endonuclease domain-containing protein [Chloroflexi bacterium]|nr:endonuclease domain-containing protein [Chloroflexota bacterium]